MFLTIDLLCAVTRGNIEEMLAPG